MRILILVLALWGFQSHARTPLEVSCEANLAKADFGPALEVVAKAMGYTTDELCALPHLFDIYIERRTLYNAKNEAEPHVWVTLHYNEYSCQYFVRDADHVVTRKNCYNTW